MWQSTLYFMASMATAPESEVVAQNRADFLLRLYFKYAICHRMLLHFWLKINHENNQWMYFMDKN